MMLSHSLKYEFKGHLEDRLKGRDEGSLWQRAASLPLLQQFHSAPGLHSSPSKTRAMQLSSSLSLGRQFVENLWLFTWALWASQLHPNQLIRGFLLASLCSLGCHPSPPSHCVLTCLIACSLVNCLEFTPLPPALGRGQPFSQTNSLKSTQYIFQPVPSVRET